MTGVKAYYPIPLLTRFLKIKFYIGWQDWDDDGKKTYKIGFQKDRMTLEQAFLRLERKRLWREKYN